MEQKEAVFNKQNIVKKMKGGSYIRKHWPEGIERQVPDVAIFINKYNEATKHSRSDCEIRNMAVYLFMNTFGMVKKKFAENPQVIIDMEQACVYSGHLLVEILNGAHPKIRVVRRPNGCVDMRSSILMVSDFVDVLRRDVLYPIGLHAAPLKIEA